MDPNKRILYANCDILVLEDRIIARVPNVDWQDEEIQRILTYCGLRRTEDPIEDEHENGYYCEGI